MSHDGGVHVVKTLGSHSAHESENTTSSSDTLSDADRFIHELHLDACKVREI